jgi:tRNA (cytidine/uridine-2'-O-)-methyltransferase
MRVVLVEPLIPPNTGNIGRLCAGHNIPLHLIEPLGFSLDDKHMKRAGLDYWKHIDLHVHPNLEDLFSNFGQGTPWLFSTHATRNFWDVSYGPDDLLIFGQETKGLSPEIRAQYPDNLLTLPHNNNIRSMNLANTVAVAVYEALRQNR